MRVWGDSRDELLGRPGPFDNQIKTVKRDELRAIPRAGDVAINDVIVRERIDVLLFDQAAGILPLAEYPGPIGVCPCSFALSSGYVDQYSSAP